MDDDNEIEQQTQTSIPPTPVTDRVSERKSADPSEENGENADTTESTQNSENITALKPETITSTEIQSQGKVNEDFLSSTGNTAAEAEVKTGEDETDPKISLENEEGIINHSNMQNDPSQEIPVNSETPRETLAGQSSLENIIETTAPIGVEAVLEVETAPPTALDVNAEVAAIVETPVPTVVDLKPEEPVAVLDEADVAESSDKLQDSASASEKLAADVEDGQESVKIDLAKSDDDVAEAQKLNVFVSDEAQSSIEEQSSRIVSEIISSVLEQLSTASPEPPPEAPGLPHDSEVEYAKAEDTMSKTNVGNQPINFKWTFGINRRIPCLNLADESRDVVLYASSHVAVLYDYTNNTQKLLQGHGNVIACVACSEDKRWLVTGEKGPDSCVIVWDTYSGIPVQVIFDIPGSDGVIAVGMSNDAKYIVTVNAGSPQSVSVWDWTSVVSEPIYDVILEHTHQNQYYITFHPLNNQLFVTSSESQVIFFCWERGSLEFHSPTLNDTTFNKVVGTYSQTIFQASLPTRCLTATSQGNIAVWDPERPDKKRSPDGFVPSHKKRALKLVRVMDRGITALAQTEHMVVSGNTAGHVTFFDHNLNLIMSYTSLKVGPINGISFKFDPEFDLEPTNTFKQYPLDSTIAAKTFVAREFIVSTKYAEVVHVETAGTTINKIIQEHDAAVHALAASPSKPWICIGSFAGLLKLWNYETKQALVTRLFEKRVRIRSLAFSHNGLQLAVGMQSGAVHILDAMSFTDEVKFQYSRDAIIQCAFSLDSKYLATADEEYTTTVFIYSGNMVWKYLGRYKAHYKPINDIAFGVDVDMNRARLMTLGQDRILVEYDLANSSKDNLQLLSVDRIEQSAVPLCLAWFPPISKETFLLTGNDQYKMKMYNTTTKMCRKTLLGPTFGTPVSLIQVVPAQPHEELTENRLLCYATKTKIGIQLLPLDGNPHRSTSCIAHPNGISTIACGFEGNYVFTAGGRESTVHMWSINRDALNAVAALGGEGLTPFYGLLDGGKEGQMFSELENYFYYAQIRSQGINTTEEREVSKVVPLDQVPFIMRALGFYPSEQEIEDMLNEVKFSDYVESGQYVTDIDLADLIKLYINHRPAFGLSSEDLYKAFEVLAGSTYDDEPSVDRGMLLSILQRKGEHMTEYELAECLTTLLGQRPEGGSVELGDTIDQFEANKSLDASLPEEINPSIFAREILGLNLYE